VFARAMLSVAATLTMISTRIKSNPSVRLMARASIFWRASSAVNGQTAPSVAQAPPGQPAALRQLRPTSCPRMQLLAQARAALPNPNSVPAKWTQPVFQYYAPITVVSSSEEAHLGPVTNLSSHLSGSDPHRLAARTPFAGPRREVAG
jgi:hypothetical protein